MWSASDGALIWEREAAETYGVAYSHDGALLAWRVRGAVTVVDAAAPSSKPLRRVKVGGIGEIAFHPTSAKLAVVKTRSIAIVDAASGEVESDFATSAAEQKRAVNRIAFSPDGTQLLTSTHVDGIVGLWDVEAGELLCRVVELGSRVAHLQFHPDGRHFLVAGFKDARIYRAGAA